MNVIRKLDPHVADLIAAGEVVERPASVVKELLENSIDAGAKHITVEIQRGGMSLIRVTDDGCGMSPEDAAMAFQRHATSKLRDAYGLEAIRTLGFRGEALAAIASVSRVQLMTRLRGSDEGISLCLEGGEERSREAVGCPEGSTMLVRDLFFNTPARLKFMKKDSAEGSSVTDVVIRQALSHPEISFRYLREGKEEFQTPGNGKLDGCIYALLGRDFAMSMLPARGSGPEVQVEGFVCPPANARGNRRAQFFFVNGRYVRSALLQAALEQAYRNRLFTGRFPSCVLFVSLRHSAVDVNVHPAKTEVRFLQEKAVFDAVYRTVLAALDGEREAPAITLPGEAGEKKNAAPEAAAPVAAVPAEEAPLPAAPPKAAPAVSTTAAKPAPGRSAAPMGGEHRSVVYARNDTPRAPMPEIVEQLVLRHPAAAYRHSGAEEVKREEGKQELPQKADPAPQEAAIPAATAPKAAIPEEGTVHETLPGAEAELPRKILGEAFDAYIVVEQGSELLLIDKHAAHERILFVRLKASQGPRMSQQLLSPQVVETGAEEAELLLEHEEVLAELGLEAERFGPGALLLRCLPEGFDPGEAAALLDEVAEGLRLGRKPGSLGPRDEAFAAMACKAAIKAGRASGKAEWEPLVQAVISGQVKYCPHGRPVTMRLTKSQIDRNFKRS